MRTSYALALRLLRLGLPIAAGRLGIVGMGVADTIVVGQLAPHDLAAQGLGWTLTGPVLLGGIGLLLGVQVLVARAVGAGQTGICGGIWRKGLVIALAAGLLVCGLVWSVGDGLLLDIGIDPELARRGAAVGAVLALSAPVHLIFMASAKFLEALERPIPGAAIMWIGNGVNLLLNLALVPQIGALGSAWATVMSQLFLAMAIVGYLAISPTLRKVAFAPAKPRQGYSELIGIGAPSSLSALVEAAAFAAMTMIAAREGGPLDVATWVIATGSLVTIVYLLAQGISTAGVVLVSEAVGAGSTALARRTGWTAIALTSAAMLLCGVICVAFAPQVAAVFTTDPQVQASLVAVMVLVALLMIPDGGQGAVDAILRTRGEHWFPTTASVGFSVIAPPLAYWLTQVTTDSVTGVLQATVVSSFAAFGIMMMRLAAEDRHVRPVTLHQQPALSRT